MKDLEDLILEHGLKFLENVLTKEKELPDSLIKIIIKEGNLKHFQWLLRNIKLKDVHITQVKNFIKNNKNIHLLMELYEKAIIDIDYAIDFIKENIHNEEIVYKFIILSNEHHEFKESHIYEIIYKKYFYQDNEFLYNEKYKNILIYLIRKNFLNKDEDIKLFHIFSKNVEVLSQFMNKEHISIPYILSEIKGLEDTLPLERYQSLLNQLLRRIDLDIKSFLFIFKNPKFEYLFINNLESEEVLVFLLDNVNNKKNKYNLNFNNIQCRKFATILFRLYFKQEYIEKYHHFLDEGDIFHYPLSEYLIETVIKNKNMGYIEFSLLLKNNGNNISKEKYLELFETINKEIFFIPYHLQYLFTEESKDIIGVGEISFLFDKIKTDLDFRISLASNQNLIYEIYHKLSKDKSKQVRKNLVDSCNHIQILQHLSIDKIPEIKNAAIKKLELLSN
jgi:hypothetical protein